MWSVFAQFGLDGALLGIDIMPATMTIEEKQLRSCDLVACGDNSSKFVNTNGVTCEADDFDVSGDFNKFGDQHNSAWIQFTVAEYA